MRERHRRFVLEYLIDLNGRAAAIRAGYAPGKASGRAWELLRRADVQAMLRAEMDARDERLRLSADRLRLEYARIALLDPRRMLRWGPEGVELIASDRLTADETAAVKLVSVGGRKGARAQRFELYDKLKALDALGRLMGVFTRGKGGRFALPEDPEPDRDAVMRKVERLIDAKAEALAEEKFAAMKAAERGQTTSSAETEESVADATAATTTEDATPRDSGD
jgi:phage terminase small subunit